MAAEKERAPGLSSAEIGKYLDILTKDPNSRVFAPLAEAYRKAGLCDDAIEIALEGLKAHPNYLGGRVALGRAYFEKNQLAEAAAEMQKVAKSAPDNIIAHKVLGQIAFRQKNLAAAEQSFKMVLILDPRDEEAQQFIANIAGPVAAAPAPVPPALVVSPPPPPQPPPPPPRSAVISLPMPAPPPPVPPASLTVPTAPLPFDELQAIEDIDLQADDIFGGQPPSPDDGMELEVFAREVRKEDSQQAVPPPAAFSPTSAAATPPDAETGREDSPFEIFTRDRGVKAPPAPGKVDRAGGAGPRELEIETTAYNLLDTYGADDAGDTDAQPASPEDELPEPLPASPAPQREPEQKPEQELQQEPEQEPELEPVLELELEQQQDPEPKHELEPESVFGLEPERELQDLRLEIAPEPALQDLRPETAPAPELTIEPESGPEMDLEVDLASDIEPYVTPIPSSVPTPEMHLETPEEEYEDLSPEEEPAAADAGRGVFDTETLASIYTSQGFYGRAAEIYQRLLAQRPGDMALRGKLEEVLALERKEMGFEDPVVPAFAPAVAPFPAPPPLAPAVAVPAAAARAGSDQTISQLNALLEAFKGGRPR